MGGNQEDLAGGLNEERFQKIVKAWMVCLGSFLISMLGGLVLVYWELKYHRTNSQQWMVPCGLILFITPILAYAAVTISDVFTTPSKDSTTDLSISSKYPSIILPYFDSEYDSKRADRTINGHDNVL